MDPADRNGKNAGKPAGLYVHVPFCVKKCRYCDFFSIPEIGFIPDYVAALQAEIRLAGSLHPDLSFDTVYLGGGTPSLLSPRQLEEILMALRRSFRIAPYAQVSMELNPGTIDPPKLAAYRGMGVSRVNLGVQSFDDDALVFLGRIHDAKTARRAMELCREAGFCEVGADLILAVPGRGMRSLADDLKTLLSFSPEHLACYLLSLEPGTPLTLSAEQGAFTPFSGDRAAADFLFVCHVLEKRGFRHYEVSNWSRGPDHLSLHNVKYWQGAPYLGLGPAAHSFTNGVRWSNHRSLSAYLYDLSEGSLPVRAKEELTKHQRMLERLYLGLRCDTGLCVPDFAAEFFPEAPALWQDEIRSLAANRMARWDGSTLFLLPRGMLVLDAVVGRLAGRLEGAIPFPRQESPGPFSRRRRPEAP
ncbi:MAG: radical SAM family heme chaperone HemW [Thermodesulfobacteriota bacterium]